MPRTLRVANAPGERSCHEHPIAAPRLAVIFAACALHASRV